jgi:hypothetical protein
MSLTVASTRYRLHSASVILFFFYSFNFICSLDKHYNNCGLAVETVEELERAADTRERAAAADDRKEG